MTARFIPAARTDATGSVVPVTVEDALGTTLRSVYARPATLPDDFVRLLAKIDANGRRH